MNSICNKLKRYHLSHETCFFDTPNPISWVSYMGYLAGNYPPCMKVNVFLVGKGWIFSTFAIFEIHREGWKYIVLSGKKTQYDRRVCWTGLTWQLAFDHGLTSKKSAPLPGCKSYPHENMFRLLKSWSSSIASDARFSTKHIQKYHKWYTWYQNGQWDSLVVGSL